MNNSILRQIPSEAQIKRELKRNLFDKRLFCPHCGSGQIKKYEKRFHCKTCRKHFSLTSVSWLKSAKLPLATIWLLLWCWINKTLVDQVARIAGVSQITSKRWYDKFRDHLPKEKLENVRLEDVVQNKRPNRWEFSLTSEGEANTRQRKKGRKFSFCQYQKFNSKYQKKHLLLFHLVNYSRVQSIDKINKYAIIMARVKWREYC